MNQIQHIKIYPFLKPYRGKKDGKQQLMMRSKIGHAKLGKIKYRNPIDVKIITKNGELIRLTPEEFHNRKNNSSLAFRLYEAEGLLRGAIRRLTLSKREIDSKTLFKEAYEVTLSLKDSDDLIENEETRQFFDYPIPEKVWELFTSQIHIDSETNAPVLVEELEDIAKGIEVEYYHDKAQRQIK